jgi:hypothetical protein
LTGIYVAQITVFLKKVTKILLLPLNLFLRWAILLFELEKSLYAVKRKESLFLGINQGPEMFFDEKIWGVEIFVTLSL